LKYALIFELCSFASDAQLEAYDKASGGQLENEILSARRSVWGVASSTTAEIRKSRTHLLTTMKKFSGGSFEIEYAIGSGRVPVCQAAWVVLTT
jgi:hypothetical protein